MDILRFSSADRDPRRRTAHSSSLIGLLRGGVGWALLAVLLALLALAGNPATAQADAGAGSREVVVLCTAEVAAVVREAARAVTPGVHVVVLRVPVAQRDLLAAGFDAAVLPAPAMRQLLRLDRVQASSARVVATRPRMLAYVAASASAGRDARVQPLLDYLASRSAQALWLQAGLRPAPAAGSAQDVAKVH